MLLILSNKLIFSRNQINLTKNIYNCPFRFADINVDIITIGVIRYKNRQIIMVTVIYLKTKHNITYDEHILE